ncbi:FabD/lysophospholipase-like protein [Coemansia reversa NRRL 1564]|uniref:Lysophospholipase n=1 Tax=Coemansia reversa (strain ATCC 12441 / NRRL 1564) TaxID=763665 RepID=A0A2G5BIW0_COERN|nr:FabD/lysophospholipase-like protein [Coemansia reversa NRRL 1564]|eukprot:PIA18945.1 FabD/lysophospholipase-like protein [Coemansia reversa NRRL 1564]
MQIVTALARIHGGSQCHTSGSKRNMLSLHRRIFVLNRTPRFSRTVHLPGIGGRGSHARVGTLSVGGWPRVLTASLLSTVITAYCLSGPLLLEKGPGSDSDEHGSNSKSGSDHEKSGTENAAGADNDHESVGSQSNTIQSLYNTITTGLVASLTNSELAHRNVDVKNDKSASTADRSSNASHPADSQDRAWYTELLGVLELLGASSQSSEDLKTQAESKTPTKSQSTEEEKADYLSWLTNIRERLDNISAQILQSGADTSAVSGLASKRDNEPETGGPFKDVKMLPDNGDQSNTMKDQVLGQISAIQIQLGQQIDDARSAFENTVHDMLPLQLQRPWVTECAQNCLDKEIHAEPSETTLVRIGSDICRQEADFQRRRAEKIRNDFAGFIGVASGTVDVRDIPVIGIASSGGGFRAMIATLGSYRAMHQAGLAQCAMYDAAVSGSSWTVAALHTYASGNPFRVLDSVHLAMKTSMFSTSNLKDFIVENDGMAKRVFADIAARYLLSTAKDENTQQAADGSAEESNGLASDPAKIDKVQVPASIVDRMWGEVARQGAKVADTVLPEQLQLWRRAETAAPAPLTMDELLQVARTTLGSLSTPPLSIVDLYGALLFKKLIVQHISGGEDDAKPDLKLDLQWVKLSAQRAAVDEGRLPMPIYTAVRHFIGTQDNNPDNAPGHKYQWIEMNPYEIGSIDHGAWVSSWAFGRPMAKGREQLRVGEAHFGSIMGAVSSAFCASVNAMMMEVYMAVPSAVRGVLDPLLDWIDSGAQTSHPIPPYTIYNPFFKTDVPGASAKDELSELGSKPLLSLMDAGMQNNLPFAPLLRAERGVDVIVCLDASANIDIMPWFARAEAWASDHGIERWPWGARPWAVDTLRPSKSEEELNKSTLRGTRSICENTDRRLREDNVRCVVFDQAMAPSPLSKQQGQQKTLAHPPLTILYLPLLPNRDFRDPEFNPETADFCATFNDKWTSEQIDQLADLASLNFTQELERIRGAVRTAYLRKRAHRLFREGAGK